MSKCTAHDHYELSESVCPDCELQVDAYGNTEDLFAFCCFPDCGCDGERLCMAPSGANFASRSMNIERGSLPAFRNWRERQ